MTDTKTPLVELLSHRLAPTTLAAALLLPVAANAAVAPRTIPLVQRVGRSDLLVLNPSDGSQPSTYICEDPETIPDQSSEHLAFRLKEETGLPVSQLAKLALVSRQTFHAWLEGGKISDANAAKLSSLIEFAKTIRAFRPDIGRFLVSDTPAGKPMDLLINGDFQAALGLAIAKEGIAVPTSRGVVRSLGRSRNLERINDQFAAVSMRYVEDAQESLPESYIVPIGTLRIG